MPSCELWLWLLSLCVNMSEGRFWFVFGFKTSVGWHRLLVPANLELRDLFNSVITFLLRTMTSSPFSVWLICLSSISSMSFSLISEILKNGITYFFHQIRKLIPNFVLFVYSIVSIKRTGCNKRTGWSKNFI